MKHSTIDIEDLFDTSSAIYMCAKRSYSNCKVGLYGVPYDGTTSFRPGARFGPSAIKEVSNALETFCPQLGIDLEEINFVDFGLLEIPLGAPEPVIAAVKACTETILSLGIKPLMLGGEHSISSGAVSAIAQIYSDLVLIQLDAHADLRNQWLGSKNSHACAMRRCLEVLPSKNLLQLAIRSGTKKEFQELNEHQRLIPHKSGEKAIALEQALKPYIGRPIYLTIDLDWFDPSILPGTGTPEPGGFFWQDFAAVIDVLKNHNLIAADIVELAPELDTTKISSLLAAKVTRSLLMLLNRRSLLIAE